jgi:hypothetical protein
VRKAFVDATVGNRIGLSRPLYAAMYLGGAEAQNLNQVGVGL